MASNTVLEQEIASLFSEDMEMVLFKSNNELIEKISKYLEDTPLREDILRNSFKRILKMVYLSLDEMSYD
jgi:spore maturation protein CgeB